MNDDGRWCGRRARRAGMDVSGGRSIRDRCIGGMSRVGRSCQRIVAASHLADQVATEARIHELGGTVVVVHVVDASGSGFAMFPAGGKWSERFVELVLSGF